MNRLITLISLAVMAGPDRGSITAVEKAIDRRFEMMFEDPFLLLGSTRGVYLEGTGTIFTAEMSLLLTPSSPFAPKLEKADMERIRKKRLERLPVLRESMQDMMVRSAEMLPALPANEQFVLGVTIFRKSSDDNTGIPAQIVMQAAKKDLVEKNKSAIRTQEF